MIGVAVVSLFTVFGASLKATMDRTVSRSFAGDLAVSAPAFGGGGSGVSPRLAPALAKLPEVATSVGLGRGVAQVNGEGGALTVTDPMALAEGFDLGSVRGSLAGLGTDGIAVSDTEAAKRGLTLGGTAELSFTDGEKRPFTVRAVYGRSELAGDYVKASEGAGDTSFAFAVPPAQPALGAAMGLTAGAVAGRRPARGAARGAARLDILRAIAME